MTVRLLQGPSAQDIVYVAQHMRDSDRIELAAGGHVDILKTLEDSVRVSNAVYVAVGMEWNSPPVALYGVAEDLDGSGIPWLLGTPELPRHSRALVEHGKRLVRDWRSDYRKLHNFVHVENHRSIRWLQHLGFTVERPTNNPFRYFHLE